MARATPCPPDDLQWAIAVARLVLPPSVHVQAPPNLSDDLAPLLAAGIDDWGGVSPVTADHVNPERAWPALDLLRAATEAAGHVLAPRMTVYPEFALAPSRWLDEAMRFPVLDASDAEGLARDGAWCSGGEAPPPALLDEASPTRLRGPGNGAPASSWRRRRGAGRRRPGPGGRRGRDRHPVLGPWPRGPPDRRGRRRAAPHHRRRRRHLRAQPQHQLHERLHVQVPLLRLLEGAALAQLAGRPVPARAERGHRPCRRSRGRGRHRGLPAGRHPPQLRRRLLPARARGRAQGLGDDPHPRLHGARGDRRARSAPRWTWPSTSPA